MGATMISTGVLCFLASLVLVITVQNLSRTGLLLGVVISWLALCFGGAALYAKEKAVARGISGVGRLFATLVTVLVLGSAVPGAIQNWESAQGLPAKIFLLWLAIIGIMVLWIPLRAGEEK